VLDAQPMSAIVVLAKDARPLLVRVGRERCPARSRRSFRPRRSGPPIDREQLDPIPVRVGYLDPHEAVVLLPFGFRRAGLAEPLARASDLVGALELEAEVVAARKLGRHRALTQRDQRPVRRSHDQEMLVVVDPLGQPEVLAVEGRGPLPIADRQSDMIQGHLPIIPSSSLRPMIGSAGVAERHTVWARRPLRLASAGSRLVHRCRAAYARQGRHRCCGTANEWGSSG
jgi:hypothetical protein